MKSGAGHVVSVLPRLGLGVARLCTPQSAQSGHGHFLEAFLLYLYMYFVM
jgi:hypothetical protein